MESYSIRSHPRGVCPIRDHPEQMALKRAVPWLQNAHVSNHTYWTFEVRSR